jgi:signal transduction histidine kinase
MNPVNTQRGALSRWIARLRVGQSLALTIGVLLVLAVIGIGLALLADGEQTRTRNFLLNQIGPARRSSLTLVTDLVNEETGVRGYVITANPRSLEPYDNGLREERSAFAELRLHERAVGPALALDLAAVHARILAWRARFVEPALADPRLTARRAIGSDLAGKTQFDALRASLGVLQNTLERRDTQARNELQSAAATLDALLIVAAVLIVGGVLAAGLFLRQFISRPLSRLGADARRVTGGEFSAPLAPVAGPREIVEVAAEMEAMRERIVQELATVRHAQLELAEQAADLSRSNAELEQFAYVASHDLQEPLRKVASFCQALQLRYQGQLDERADQYIEFAVDGAKRMQMLINALLALSRVGRGGSQRTRVELADVLAAAQASLAGEIEASGANVLAEALPAVIGEQTLLISLFQNLIGNAIKFRSERPPVVRVGCERVSDVWQLSFTDNGIGIEVEYAERIFQIFQRLHGRDAYDGTGIGLALCRKIVEYHGGRIWLDPEHADGTRFVFTLPITQGDLLNER